MRFTRRVRRDQPRPVEWDESPAEGVTQEAVQAGRFVQALGEREAVCRHEQVEVCRHPLRTRCGRSSWELTPWPLTIGGSGIQSPASLRVASPTTPAGSPGAVAALAANSRNSRSPSGTTTGHGTRTVLRRRRSARRFDRSHHRPTSMISWTRSRSSAVRPRRPRRRPRPRRFPGDPARGVESRPAGVHDVLELVESPVRRRAGFPMGGHPRAV